MTTPTNEGLYRKKSIVIKASQWFKDGDHPEVMKQHDGSFWVPTLEGGHVVTPGDWIITGIKGEHYPCKPDIFALTYERASAVDSLTAAPAPTDAQIEPATFREILDWRMCSDPWPGGDMQTVDAWMDARSRELGYSDWLDAYHTLQKLPPAPSPEGST